MILNIFVRFLNRRRIKITRHTVPLWIARSLPCLLTLELFQLLSAAGRSGSLDFLFELGSLDRVP